MGVERSLFDTPEASISRFRVLVCFMAAVAGVLVGAAWSLALQVGLIPQLHSEYPVRFSLPSVSSSWTGEVPAESTASDAVPAQSEVVEPPANALSPPQAAKVTSAGSAQPFRPATGSMLALDYDLARTVAANRGEISSEGAVETRMALFVDGASRGEASIRIADSAQILIATDAVAAAIGERRSRLPSRLANMLESGEGFIPFYELRAAGITVEYDPIKDSIALTLPS